MHVHLTLVFVVALFKSTFEGFIIIDTRHEVSMECEGCGD